MPAGRQGFTLIEILVAATIIAVLSAIGVSSYSSVNRRSRDAKRISDLEQVRSALEMYRTDNGFYPDTGTGFKSLSDLESSLVSAYMPSVPVDPKGDPYWYSPLGAAAPYYNYCVCAKLENPAGSGTCAGVTLPGDPDDPSCNYGLKSP